MAISQDSREHIETIADDTLTKFATVAEAASSALCGPSNPGAGVFASVNTFTSAGAVQSLSQNSFNIREKLQQLAKEPAIARVVVADMTGKKTTYYICRAAGDFGMASYNSAVGRLASLPVGETHFLPHGTVEVLERALLHPVLIDQKWDSRNSVLESDDFGPVTVESLRALLKRVVGGGIDLDLLEHLLAEETDTANVREGIRRNVINKMGLRDQPVLDKYQDEIFRLPLDTRLMILGPPGTGKTTTLIRRLGQKLDVQFLEDEERRVLENTNTTDGIPHAQSWLMFTPTELLKQYVKEAFARESIPASDDRITTWSIYRHELARNVLGVLRTGAGGAFVLKETAETLGDDAPVNAIIWFSDFNEWQRDTFISEIRMAAQELSKISDSKFATIGGRLLKIVNRAEKTTLATLFTGLNAEVSGIQAVTSVMKEVTDKKIRGALILQVNRNKNFLDELAAFIDDLQVSTAAENDELDDQDGDDDEEPNQPKTGRAAAQSAYMKAVRAQTRAQVKKRSLGKTTRNGKIIEWLGDRTLVESDRAEVGASLLVQASARRFVNPVKKYIDGIPKRYRGFRRLRKGEGKWYRSEDFSQTDIHPLELDIVLLTILRGASEFLSVPGIVRDIDAPGWSSLRPIHALYKNQILVDEATDFSPVQIACMGALANPRIRSFFACGDFNQRFTTWGSRSVDDMKWVFPEIEIKAITVSYRQSRQLNDLAKAIIHAADGTDSDVVLPEFTDNECVPPVLSEGMSLQGDVIHWLAQRIAEIESFVEHLPSIAILVDSEEKVNSIAEELNLNEKLSNLNIRVVACPKGQVKGQDNDVRVFDVQHIKGLEFEAVFFIGIDRLASIHPELFDKYLYVGSTRAATYLGVTCDGELPDAIAGLRSMFASNWSKV